MERIDLDFSVNPMQSELCYVVLEAAAGSNPYRIICAAGSIRSGKTFGMLGLLTILCGIYPGSKWIVYRKDFPSLMDTTIPSLDKIIGGLPQWKWHRSPSNYHVEYENGSKIFFYGENIQQDPDLHSMLGVECNGIFLEQVEELSEKLFTMAQSRIGSQYLDKMPSPLILMTANPTQSFIKDLFYTPWRNGELQAPFYFLNALAKDNPFITEEQRSAWDRLDEKTKRQFIDADWTNMQGKDDLWAYAFDRTKHLAKNLDMPCWKGDQNQYLYLSFDFNRNPITCCVIQHYDGIIRVLEQIKLSNSDIYKLCDHIKALYPGFFYTITGDATGQSSSAMVQDNLTYYKIIQTQLQLGPAQFKLPSVNPKIADNQVLVNSLLSRYEIQIHPEKAKSLIYDLENVRMFPDGTIIKANRADPKQQSDALDSFRYFCNQFMKHFVLLKEKQ
jgi:hypothetical protein